MTKLDHKLRPSQLVNLGWLILAIGGIWIFAETENLIFLFPLLIWIWKALVISCWYYYMNEDLEYIIEKKGVFSIRKTQIQYFRIKSIEISRPFLLRIFGLSNVKIITSEPFKPFLVLYAVSDGEIWAEYCREMAKYWREEKGVKETDFHHF